MLGDHLKKLLYEQHRTQVWLAKQCGVTKGHINQIISGKTQPSLQLLLKIAKALSVDIGEIVNVDFQ